MQNRSILIDQAAALLGISRRTVYYWIREGRLRTVPTQSVSQRVTLESVELARATKRIRRPAADVSDTGPCERYRAP